MNIFSDSQFAIKSLSNIFLNLRPPLDFRSSLNEMAEKSKNPSYLGHSDIPENCRADEWASLKTPGKIKSVEMPPESCRLNLRNSFAAVFQGLGKINKKYFENVSM